MKLIRLDSVTIARGDDIDIGVLYGTLATLLYGELDSAVHGKHLAGRIDTGHDRLMGGALMYATYAYQTLKGMVDWRALEDKEGVGVFAYDFLEAQFHEAWEVRKDFASFLLRETPEKVWYEIADNWMVPAVEDMKAMINRWAAEVDLPLIPGDQSELAVYTRKLEAHLKRFYGLELNDTYYEKPEVVAGLMADKVPAYEAINLLAAESGLDRLDFKQGGLTAADDEAV